MVGIYKIESPSGKVYIGQSVNITDRKRRYANLHCKGQRKIYRSIMKYGWDKHIFSVLIECEINRLNDLEIYYSELYDSTNPKTGLNLRYCGGSRGKASEETKKLMSIAMTGKKHTDEARAKIKERRKYQVITEETKMKLRGRTAWNKGLPLSKETRQKLRDFNTGLLGVDAFGHRGIIQSTKNGTIINFWHGARDVARGCGYAWGVINRCARGERLTAYGYKWEYD
jgi:group I intron endonuclease